MRNYCLTLILLLLITGIGKAQTENKFYQFIPKEYQLKDVNEESGPSIEEDFDNDGVKDLAILLFEKKNGTPIFCIYLSKNFTVSKSFKYCDWEFMKHELNYEDGIISLASDNGSMGPYASMKLKYDDIKKNMIILKYEDVAGNKTILFKDWKLTEK